jgi:hypothetical protein
MQKFLLSESCTDGEAVFTFPTADAWVLNVQTSGCRLKSVKWPEDAEWGVVPVEAGDTAVKVKAGSTLCVVVEVPEGVEDPRCVLTAIEE